MHTQAPASPSPSARTVSVVLIVWFLAALAICLGGGLQSLRPPDPQVIIGLVPVIIASHILLFRRLWALRATAPLKAVTAEGHFR